MSSNAELHLLYQVANAPMKLFPFPHIYVRDVFPGDFYREIRKHLPPAGALKTLRSLGRVGAAYSNERLVLPLVPEEVARLPEPYQSFWDGTARWLLGSSFAQLAMSKFKRLLEERFGDARALEFFDEALLVQDYTSYVLGPHTDSPAKVLSFLFYLPPDDSQAHLGTSIYVPKDPNFVCEGGPHYVFDAFNCMLTMPYVPNSLFAFMKTPNSFHGVEPIQEREARRDLLLYDIKVKQRPAAEPQPARAAGPVKFSF